MRLPIEEFAKSGGTVKIIRGMKTGYEVNPILEWLKWLSYIPIHEEQRIAYLCSKKAEDLSIDEHNEIIKHKERKRMAQLFTRYNNCGCSEDEYMEVYHYMGKSIIELMMDRLNTEELAYAKETILKLSTASSDELDKKIQEEKKEDVYMNLPMVDAYILHFITRINYGRITAATNHRIQAESDRNAAMAQRVQGMAPYMRK